MRRHSHPEPGRTVLVDVMAPVELVTSKRDRPDELGATVLVSEGTKTTTGGYWERATGKAASGTAAVLETPAGDDSMAVTS